MLTLADLPWRTTVATTLPPFRRGLPRVTLAPSPTSSTSPNSTVAPGSASSFSTRRTPSLETRYCFPPVAMTAYIVIEEGNGGRRRPRILLADPRRVKRPFLQPPPAHRERPGWGSGAVTVPPAPFSRMPA